MAANCIVIGAGMAGLCTAYELKKAGFNVHVLEGRGRAGGRVETISEPFADGLYADTGAMSFPDTQPTIIRYVHEFDLPLTIDPTGGEEAYSFGRNQTFLGSKPSSWPVKLTPEEEKLGIDGLQKKYLSEPAMAIGDVTKPGWPTRDLSALDGISAAEYLKRQGASPGAIELIALGLVDYFGEGLDSCSALFILVSQQVSQGYKNVFRVNGGMEELPRRIALRLRREIRYGCTVTGIQQDATGVTVQYLHGGHTDNLRADYLVSAIPFTLLRDVAVSPAFSAPKTKLIAELPNTSVTRVYVQTGNKDWEQHGLPGSGETATPVEMLIFPGYTRPSHRALLESYAAGPSARKLAAMTPKGRFDYVVAEMTRLFPGLAKTVEAGAFKIWDDDPFARGAYAWYRPGQFLEFLPHLASPEGRVFFAGDQTSLMPGWIEGALLSGVRAAGQIQAHSGMVRAATAA